MIKKKGIQRRKSFTAVFHNKNDQFECHSCNREYDDEEQQITQTKSAHKRSSNDHQKQRRKTFTATFHNKKMNLYHANTTVASWKNML